MHCEEAPCENVCPVGATVHDSEGLNVMVYNRCVGTRFCSNNCPYKVRRFNFYGYGNEQHRPAQSLNPDVTVRARGVMEKCSYCVQRIAEARIVADRESKPVGEVKTACQAACPAQAFTFGNLADANSEVSKRKRSPLDFAMLEAQEYSPADHLRGAGAKSEPQYQGAGHVSDTRIMRTGIADRRARHRTTCARAVRRVWMTRWYSQASRQPR